MFFSLGALAVAATVVAPQTLGAPGPDTLRVLVIVADTEADASFTRGIRLGADEASRTGALFGTTIALTVATPASIDSVTGAGASRLVPRPSLLIARGTADQCAPAVSMSARWSIPLLDAGCGIADSQRTPTIYSIVLPPDAGAPRADDDSRLELWSATIERFGGEQLNERFRRRFSMRIDSPAWTGWMAMKIALDLSLRSHSTSASSLLAQLADPATQFDGQKGKPLRFDRATRRMIQPAYRVVGSGDTERVVAEVVP